MNIATQKSFTTGGNQTATSAQELGARKDAAETLLKKVDETTRSATGVSLFHVLTLGSIGASIALFLAGKRQAGIFVGLWPPTFQALKSVVNKNS